MRRRELRKSGFSGNPLALREMLRELGKFFLQFGVYFGIDFYAFFTIIIILGSSVTTRKINTSKKNP
jgi:hypothetical protein